MFVTLKLFWWIFFADIEVHTGLQNHIDGGYENSKRDVSIDLSSI